MSRCEIRERLRWRGAVLVNKSLIPYSGSLPIDREDRCKPCSSDGLRDFNAELAVHFPGPDNLTKPIVWVFPVLRACLDCGHVEFDLPDAEREELKNGDSPAQSQALGQ
jgi:hypothetical protein